MTMAQKILIIGAGEAGLMVAREIDGHPELELEIAGFIDDDQQKAGTRPSGWPVLGTISDIPERIAEEKIEVVIIAIPSAPGRVIRSIVSACAKTKVEVRIVPGIFEIIAGDVKLNQIREIKVVDLLGRETVKVEQSGIVKGKRVLVTGAAGSIGSELCRQILKGEPEKLIGFDSGETELFELDNDLGINPAWQGVIGDVRDEVRVRKVLQQYQPQIVFHAAAYKHVPLMEENPCEAVKTNVLGTYNVVRSAAKIGCERFILISTDKAVNPTNVMGAAKRLAERLVLYTASNRELCGSVVRFGNVLNSRGSVVTIFRRQIAAGGPVTLTHPDIIRYFMTIPEAAQLVLQAAALGKGEEIFLLDMGEPVKVIDLARNMITLSGLEVDDDIEIVISGLRPGEKLYEELLTAGEGVKTTTHPRIFVAEPEPTGKEIIEKIAKLGRHVRVEDDQSMRELLQELVPEYQPVEPEVL